MRAGMKFRTEIIMVILFAILVVVIGLDIGRLVLAPSREASIDAVRIRNAMVSELGSMADVQWTPSNVPENFFWETQDPPEFFRDIVRDNLNHITKDKRSVEAAVEIARHLRKPSDREDPIQANTRETYETIIAGKGGYCSDYTQVFNALALTAGFQVREWGFTWDEMANGHAFNEIWDETRRKWVLVDSHMSFYAVDQGSREPLSALELRERLLRDDEPHSVEVVPIVPEKLGRGDPVRLLDWYRRGLPRMFLLLGNNVFSYDSNPLIQSAEALPRSVEMLLAIAIGQHPRFLFVPSDIQPEVEDQVHGMIWSRNLLFAEFVGLFVFGLGLLIFLRRIILARSAGQIRSAGTEIG